MRKVLKISGVVLITFLVYSCKDEYVPQVDVSTKPVSDISYTTATCGGDLAKIDGASIIAVGVCWNTSGNPTVEDSRTIESGQLGVYASYITGLTPNTLYYVRAYAISTDVTGYGGEKSFTTLQVEAPVLTTTEITSITYTTATTGGNVTSDGGTAITAKGVCWSTSANPTTSDSKTTDGTGIGVFTSSITGLTQNTTYYVRAYATSSVGTGYGSERSFITSAATVPVITTIEASSITGTTATSGGNVSSDGGEAVTAYGICWSTSLNPTIADNKTTDGTGTGEFTSSITGLTAGTTYYVRAYATNSIGTSYGNVIYFTTTASVPTLTTTEVSLITETTAASGGNVTSDGGADVTVKGVCWSTSADPTTADSKTTDGSGTGIFTSSITGLTAGTTYYVRAYATNSEGTTGYGSGLSFTTLEESGETVSDKDNNVYHSVTIGTQVWMVENLKTTKYNDGSSIPLVTGNTEWENILSPAYCWNNNDEATYKPDYGALYNWYTVNTGNLCPLGWHVPTDEEWTTLATYLGGENVAGGKMKETGITHWLNPNEVATNESGFTALPGGQRWWDGTFPGVGATSYWWSSTQQSESFAWNRRIYYLTGGLTRESNSNETGFSVRCLKD